MKTSEAVTAAMMCARGKGIKSCNKVVEGDDTLGKSMKDLDRFRKEMLKAKKLPSTWNCEAAVVTAYAEAVLDAKVGNCTELAAVAFLHLMGGKCGCNTGEKHHPLELVQVAGGNHAFLLVGAQHELKKSFVFGDKLFKLEGAFACDPWAKIACHVSEYHTAWQVRMQKWDKSKKQIIGGEFGNVRYIKPLDEDWIASINHKKLDIIGRCYG